MNKNDMLKKQVQSQDPKRLDFAINGYKNLKDIVLNINKSSKDKKSTNNLHL